MKNCKTKTGKKKKEEEEEVDMQKGRRKLEKKYDACC